MPEGSAHCFSKVPLSRLAHRSRAEHLVLSSALGVTIPGRSYSPNDPDFVGLKIFFPSFSILRITANFFPPRGNKPGLVVVVEA
jgi:hypothetical protein